MSRRPGLLARVFTNFRNSISIAQQTSKYVGSDEFGNEYYEKTGDSGRNIRGQRFIKEKQGTEMQEIPEIPVEWETWLRGRRRHPPTEEEIQRNHVKMVQTKLRAAKLEGKFPKEELKEIEKSEINSITETIESNNPRQAFPRYAEYEDSPGQKYNKEDNRIK